MTDTSTIERQQVDVAHRVERDVHHPHVHAVRRLVHAGRVDEHDLAVRVVLHADDPRARGLRLVGHDRELVPDDAVQQRGLAGVRAAEEGNEAGLHASEVARAGADRSLAGDDAPASPSRSSPSRSSRRVNIAS